MTKDKAFITSQKRHIQLCQRAAGGPNNLAPQTPDDFR